YQERVAYNQAKHKSRKPAALLKGKHLYHATNKDVLPKIRSGGLLPRDPRWYEVPRTGRRYDASKDGFLSMATEKEGAGAIGSYVRVRMLIEDDIGLWDFRRIEASKEIRTTTPIPADRLEYSDDNGVTWKALV